MSLPKILGKRKCSFKPTSTVRALLTELDSLLNLLEKEATIEDFINEAIQNYIPSVILTLRNELHSKERLINIINDLKEKAEKINNANETYIDKIKNTEEEIKEIEDEIENEIPDNLTERLNF